MNKPRRLSRALDDMPGLFDVSDFSPERVLEGERDRHRRAVIDRARNTDIAQLKIDATPRGSLRFVSFGSGSSGNCSYIGTRDVGLLIDAGVDADTVEAGMKRNGLSAKSLVGILLTHDHGDHMRYAYTLLRRYSHMKLFCTPRNLTGLLRRHNVSRRIKDYHAAIFKEFPFTIGDLTVTAFETSHDGSDNMGFSIECNGTTFTMVTDTGMITDRTRHYIDQTDHLVIEANYDADMLRKCLRPEYLKARIAGERGHMDNADTAALLADAWTPRLRNIMLCHLSEDTNTPDLALTAVRGALEGRGITVGDASGSIEARKAQVQLSVLPRFENSPLLIL